MRENIFLHKQTIEGKFNRIDCDNLPNQVTAEVANNIVCQLQLFQFLKMF